MEIKRIRLTDLELNRGQVAGLPSNPRQWGKGELEDLVKSIRETPELLEGRGLLVWPYEGKFIVLGGNMRFSALRQMNAVDAPCVVYPEDTPIEKLREIIIKDNGAFGSWDYDMLANEWDDLPLSDWGVPAWSTENLEEVSAPKEVHEDDFDESKDHIEVRCKRGDVWQLGEHRLMCGDSVSLEDVKKLMGGAEADMIFTDPPYNVAIGDKNKALNAMAPCERIERNLEGDTFGSDEECGQKLWKPAFSAMRNVAKDKCAIYVTMPQGGTHMMMMMMMHEAGWQVKHELIWLKNSPTFSMGRLDYDYQHEPICFGWNKGHKKIGGGQFTKSVWTIDKPKKCDLHPTMKPIELVANAIQNSSEEGDLILDAFGGSGTTLIASEQTGRKAYLMEYDEQYCDVIIARWEKFTGKQATKIN